MKIAIIGDMHLRERPFPVRKDDYLTNVLDKFEYVLDKYEKVICLGDMFEKYENSDYVFYRVYRILSKHPDKFITIPGNHDLFGRNHNDLSKCTLGNLYLTGALELKMEPFIIDGVTFSVSLVDKSNIKDIPKDVEGNNVLLGHNYYNMETTPEESLTREDLRKLNYGVVFLGHDHSPYEDIFIENSILVRMGSFSRKDSQSYNEDREIAYYEYDTNTREIERRVVPTLSKEVVFIDNAFDKKSLKSPINFVKIGEVLKKFQKQREGSISLLKTLQRANCPQKHITMIKHFHELNEIPFF